MVPEGVSVQLDDVLVEMDGAVQHLLYRDEDSGVWRVAFVTPPTASGAQGPPATAAAGGTEVAVEDDDALEFFSD
ncbi:hypothetical protein DQ04_10211020 [Trypanosoma grayi]|uniref:hypothetical protein n=1 Tax=Trypanosoma grayi TaxID=71804 RepID=UPI0004F4AB9E|nr:hypothetical protein DQ04_10211020 [Trypanosoma grayi]KEG07314.1 hypothetical protein DQ04_10211020 [Trypanosoma grayi]